MNKQIYKDKILNFPTYLLKAIKNFNLSQSEFLILLYFWNNTDSLLDISKISDTLSLDESEIMLSFNSLLSKKIISLDSNKDSNGKITEFVNLDNLYVIIDEMFNQNTKEQEKEDIYSTFEKEFGRPISSMEYEIIRAWIEKGFTEEIILGALKEAVYNGVNNLRYIDKILYDWQKKGYKTMKDVNSHNKNKTEEKKELFDYNWLDDNE